MLKISQGSKNNLNKIPFKKSKACKSFVYKFNSAVISYYQLCSATNITIQMQFSSVQNINMVYGDLSKVSQVLSEYIIK